MAKEMNSFTKEDVLRLLDDEKWKTAKEIVDEGNICGRCALGVLSCLNMAVRENKIERRYNTETTRTEYRNRVEGREVEPENFPIGKKVFMRIGEKRC
jgi:hypothetical protein